MKFFKNIFKKNPCPVISSYGEFWDWFKVNEKSFYKALYQQEDVEGGFFDKLSPKLNELKDGFYFLAGMCDENTAELVLTADGTIKNIPFVEKLVMTAPDIKGWKFTALKPEQELNSASISMDRYDFNGQNLSFYPVVHPYCPDEIDIVVVHHDYQDEDSDTLINGTYIFLENYLGELNFAETIDDLTVLKKDEVGEQELIPIEKLKDYLVWRQKEFVEKYDGIRYNTVNDSYECMEAMMPNGKPVLAVVNRDLLEWERKASHPWIAHVEIQYGKGQMNGLPDRKMYKLLDKIENEMMKYLKDFEGYLNVGRQTSENVRNVYFACNEFRKPAVVLDFVQRKYQDDIRIEFDIYKDKYWHSFERFMPKIS